MIVSKYNKSYDTADGSEQPWAEVPWQDRVNGREAQRRWEDDGGPLNERSGVAVVPLARKPAWSVLSLVDLNEAIRREQCPDSPVRLQREADRVDRDKIRATNARNERIAAAARAERDRYRNDWEHT